MACPCETRTSTCRSFATISSDLYRFLAITVLLDVKDIPQVGPLQWGRIKNARRTLGFRSCDSSVFDALNFDIYTVANFAPITGAGREQLACFFRGLSFDAPWLRSSPGRGRQQCDSTSVLQEPPRRPDRLLYAVNKHGDKTKAEGTPVNRSHRRNSPPEAPPAPAGGLS